MDSRERIFYINAQEQFYESKRNHQNFKAINVLKQ